MSVSAKANDGRSHSVQVYTDITGEWVTGDNSLIANWTTSTADDAIIHQAQLANQSIFSEVSDHIQCEFLAKRHLGVVANYLTLRRFGLSRFVVQRRYLPDRPGCHRTPAVRL